MDEKIISYQEAMRLAIDSAKPGAPYVSPNPLVGCVVVDENHKLLATGFHQKYGEAHAEVDAIQKLRPNQLQNAIVYVTLEPCSHEGKTPSCAKALAKLPIQKVVYGLKDPNPLVAGQGIEILKAAGIQTEEYQGDLKNDLEDLCEVFLKNFREKKIFIAAKVASSLDGQIALATGESKWITGSESREKVHELRSYYDAILVGRQTIEIDNPSLNVRHSMISKQPKLIILDPQSALLKNIMGRKKYQFLEAYPKSQVYFAVKKINSEFSYQQIEMLKLNDLTEKIWNLGLRSIFIEGGAQTYSNFLNENLIDRLHLFMAPSLIGSGNGLSWTKGFAISQLAQKKNLKNMKLRQYDNDIYITGRL